MARATAAWQRLMDEGQGTVRGQELLNMWDRLSAAGLLREPAHLAVVESVRNRLSRGGGSLPAVPAAPPEATAGQGPAAPED
ncbi:hypothetical protein NGM37_30600, partial [Streptomyces sp. TRM76130]|nr:hypothetical protein [Streptomyces sp. TRM76130]